MTLRDAIYLAALNQLRADQVSVTGNATIELDEDRDYEAAFNELYGASPELAKFDLATLVSELETD